MKRVISIFVVMLLLMTTRVDALGVSARSAIVINGDTGEVIWAQNSEEKLPMASTTKIMTALLLCENADLNKEITVTADMLKIEGSSMGLLAGDKVTYHDLLYGMMLASGNDAANVTALTLGGSAEGFAKMMNNKAKELGLKNTNFVTASGLDSDGHYTTAYDLARLTFFALRNDEFSKAAASESATLNYGNPPYRRTLTNHNKLLKSFDGAVGVKTGFTKKSGRCLVSAAKKDGKFVIAVTLNDPDDWQDHTDLLQYGLDSIKQTNYTPPVDSYVIPVINGKEDSIKVFIEPVTINTLETENISTVVRLPKMLYAPVKEGDEIGSIEYKFNETVIKKVKITAKYDVLVKEIEPKFIDIFLSIIFYLCNNLV